MNLYSQFSEQKHRIMMKNYETKMTDDGKELHLNNFVQETIGNIMAGFLKTLKSLIPLPK